MAWKCRGCGGGWDYPCECYEVATEMAQEEAWKKLRDGEYDEEIVEAWGVEGEVTERERTDWFERNEDRLVEKLVEEQREEQADRKAAAMEERAEARKERDWDL